MLETTPSEVERAIVWKQSFCVCIDLSLPSGQRFINYPLSRKIARRSVARRVLKRIRRTEPGAFIVGILTRADRGGQPHAHAR